MAEDEHMAQADTRELLIRLDERLRNAVNTMEQREIYHKQDADRQASLFARTIESFTTALSGLTGQFATRVEVENVRTGLKGDISRLERIVYGACGLVLVGVVAALLSLILK